MLLRNVDFPTVGVYITGSPFNSQEEDALNRAEFFSLLSYMPTAELIRIQLAYWLAKNAHRPFNRDSGERYFEHPRAVAASLIRHGFRGTNFVVLGLIHDVIEDTNTPPAAIVNLFGGGIWRLVETLSKYVPVFDPVTGQATGRIRKENGEYYGEIARAPEIVRIVKCADRLHNLRDCGAVWDATRQKRYVEETERYILPLARLRITHEYAKELKEAVLKLKQRGSL